MILLFSSALGERKNIFFIPMRILPIEISRSYGIKAYRESWSYGKIAYRAKLKLFKN